ncbi:hypothetical protein ACKWTF_008874 [Chironomus riparius]
MLPGQSQKLPCSGEAPFQSFACTCLLNSANVNDVVFANMGTYRGFTTDGSEYQKSYFVSRWFGENWTGARSFCSSFNLQLVSLQTLQEALAFLYLADTHPYFKKYTACSMFYIDGMTSIMKSTTEWYWADSGNKISYPMPWLSGQPDNANGDERCLAFRRNTPTQNYRFVDNTCSGGPHFVCQRIDFFIA